MIALTIVVVLLGIILLLSVGVDIEYSEGVQFYVKIGPFKISLSGREFKKGKSKKDKKDKKQLSEDGNNKQKPDKSFIIDAVMAALNSLKRFRRKLSIDLLSIRYTAAASDPYRAAIQYGTVSAVLGMLQPLIFNAFVIREKEIKTYVNYNKTVPTVYVHIVATLAVWELIYVGFGFLVEILNSRYRSR